MFFVISSKAFSGIISTGKQMRAFTNDENENERHHPLAYERWPI